MQASLGKVQLVKDVSGPQLPASCSVFDYRKRPPPTTSDYYYIILKSSQSGRTLWWEVCFLYQQKNPLGTKNSPSFCDIYTGALATVGVAFALADGIMGTWSLVIEIPQERCTTYNRVLSSPGCRAMCMATGGCGGRCIDNNWKMVTDDGKCCYHICARIIE